MRVGRCGRCREFFQADRHRQYCAACAPAAARERESGRGHVTKFRGAMREVAAHARGNPRVKCCLCGRREAPPGYDGRWSAEHVEAGAAGSELLAAHLGCNSAKGNRTLEWFQGYMAERFPNGW